MPVVLYTSEKFEVGGVIDTRDLCDLNREALREATLTEREVETLLEEVRAEHFPEAPDRICSVLGVPIPSRTSFVHGEEGKYWATSIDTPEPPGIGVHCYHIAPAEGAKRLSADERYVEKLVAGWEKLHDRFERWKLASDYWSGNVLSGYSLLIEGPVKILNECVEPRGSRRLKPLVWGTE